MPNTQFDLLHLPLPLKFHALVELTTKCIDLLPPLVLLTLLLLMLLLLLTAPRAAMGGPAVQSVKGLLDTKPPHIHKLLELHWGRIGAFRVPPRSSGLSAGQPPISFACPRAPRASNEN